MPLVECPHGLKEPQYAQVTHEQILDLELLLFDELFELFGKKREDYVKFVPLYPWYRIQFADGSTFDYGGTNLNPYGRLDYARLTGWLEAILELDPRSEYPLFAAARVYAENQDPARSRTALEFVYREFFADPDRRWPWLAHAALLAKHRLNDLPLARRYAAAIDRNTRSANVPLWAKQMEIFILEDMNELEAARILLGGLLESGSIHDPAEARFLQQRLEELERRLSRP